MADIKAYRIEEEFRRQRKHGRLGRTEVQWDANAAPHMDGLAFKQGYLLVITISDSSPIHSVVYHHGGYTPFTEIPITQPDIDRLVNEKLIRELT